MWPAPGIINTCNRVPALRGTCAHTCTAPRITNLRWRGTAADATPPRLSRRRLARLSARDKSVEGARDSIAKKDVEGGAGAVARRGGHAWRAILECGLRGEGALGAEQRIILQ